MSYAGLAKPIANTMSIIAIFFLEISILPTLKIFLVGTSDILSTINI